MRTKSRAVLAIALLAAAIASIAAYVFLNRSAEPAPAAEEIAFPDPVPTARPVTPPAPPTAPAEPVVAHPIEQAPAAEPLPELDQSDAPALAALNQVLGKEWQSLLSPERLIHKIVVTVDNLPRQDLPANSVPLSRVPGAFISSGEGDERIVSPHNAERYAPYVRLIEAIDNGKLVAVYRQFYPLFQRAYVNIGFPKGYFNDRLVEAIDDLLAAPEIEGPIKLVQPKVLFQFADPELAGRSSGQKIMIRMGRDHAARLKVKLREIRQLVAQVPRSA